ncbi:MAG: site-2 protease family protein [Clostridia bacterium]|nr:site-2 protease family protein [Clostridia bacterium]
MYTLIYYILDAIAIVIVTTLFEFLKAFLSYKQGDEIPKNMGKLTLNPAKHFEPIGFLLFLFSGYGWANPVETSSRNYKDKKTGTIITYLVPMVIFVVIAAVIKIIMNVVIISDSGFTAYVSLFLAVLARNFAAVAVFNIIPVYPMSGSKLLRCFLTPNQAIKYAQYEKPLQILVIFLLVLGWLTPVLNAVVNLIV